jgi:hypothetical protein
VLAGIEGGASSTKARTPAIAAAVERVGRFILVIRRQRVLLDEDLALNARLGMPVLRLKRCPGEAWLLLGLHKEAHGSPNIDAAQFMIGKVRSRDHRGAVSDIHICRNRHAMTQALSRASDTTAHRPRSAISSLIGLWDTYPRHSWVYTPVRAQRGVRSGNPFRLSRVHDRTPSSTCTR